MPCVNSYTNSHVSHTVYPGPGKFIYMACRHSVDTSQEDGVYRLFFCFLFSFVVHNAKMSFDPKVVELTADVLEFFFL